MTKRVGILGLMAAVAVGLFYPATASAQDRDGYRHSYVERDHRDRDWHRDDRWREHEWRESRERQEWREHEWRERHDRPYYGSSYYGNGYGYRPPVVQFGYYGR